MGVEMGSLDINTRSDWVGFGEKGGTKCEKDYKDDETNKDDKGLYFFKWKISGLIAYKKNLFWGASKLENEWKLNIDVDEIDVKVSENSYINDEGDEEGWIEAKKKNY